MDRPDLDQPWIAHEQPERPLDRWTWLCDCRCCLLALQATARARPRLALVLKTALDRVIVTAELVADTWATTGTIDRLLYEENDRVEEVFVAASAPDVPACWDWSSLTARRQGAPGAHLTMSELDLGVAASTERDA